MLRQAAEVLARLLGTPLRSLRSPARELDVFKADVWTFVLRWTRSGDAGPVVAAAEAVRNRAAQFGRRALPVVAAPFMGEAGRKRCEAAGVAWIDLSGNARICGPGIRIVSLGQPNQFKRRGRPASVFAPKGARLARWLLMHADRAWSQRELARRTQVDEGYISRIVTRLEEERLIVRNEDGEVRASDPNLLLDAWREAYHFDKHTIIRGHIAARSSDELLRDLGGKLRKFGVEHAATGLGAAWLLTRFAGFRLVSYYLKEEPSSLLFDRLSFREEARGANVWLIVPNDEGVFHGATAVDGIACVHPVQAFLDLGAHPERSSDAAVELRKSLLNWNSNA